MKKSLFKTPLAFVACLFLITCNTTSANIMTNKEIIQLPKSGAKYENGQFHNSDIEWNMSFSQMWQALTAAKHEASVPDKSLPSRAISSADFKAQGIDRLYRLGHSTVLIELDGHWLLTDPVFVDRASPVQWLGPKRFDSQPVSISMLPKLKAVLISHNHYDHLSKSSIEQLIDKTEYFIVPLKLGALLGKWGVPTDKIVELDWWQGVKLDSITINATPAQHYSSRSLWDRNKSLWASYVLETDSSRIFFSGDSGYFSGFAEIGTHFGGFDIALLEVGAYNELWRDIHMMPKDAAKASLDLQAKTFVPIHNGTFDLAKHAWWEPFEAIEALGMEHGIKVLQPMFGEMLSINAPQHTLAWWKELMPQNSENNLALKAN